MEVIWVRTSCREVLVSPGDLLRLTPPQTGSVLRLDQLFPVADFEDVLVTIAFLLRKNPRARFWTTYQVRR